MTLHRELILMIQVKQSWLDPSVLGSREPFNCTYELKTHNNKYARHTVYFEGFKFPTITTAQYHDPLKPRRPTTSPQRGCSRQLHPRGTVRLSPGHPSVNQQPASLLSS